MMDLSDFRAFVAKQPGPQSRVFYCTSFMPALPRSPSQAAWVGTILGTRFGGFFIWWPMTFQDAFNIAIGLVGIAGGWILRVIWDAQRDLQRADKELADKVSAIEVVVAGEYVKRNEFAELSRALFNKLDRIEDKLDGKVDKP